MKWLKEQGADVNASDWRGYTPMHIMARRGDVEAVRWLKEQGADVNVKTNEGKTPFQFAREIIDPKNRREAMEWLRANGGGDAPRQSDATLKINEARVNVLWFVAQTIPGIGVYSLVFVPCCLLL